MTENLTIGKLASATGTKVETIRYYEQIGLLPAPARSAANYRTYEGKHLRRLSFIRRARDLGFSIDQVREEGRFISRDAAWRFAREEVHAFPGAPVVFTTEWIVPAIPFEPAPTDVVMLGRAA